MVTLIVIGLAIMVPVVGALLGSKIEYKTKRYHGRRHW